MVVKLILFLSLLGKSILNKNGLTWLWPYTSTFDSPTTSLFLLLVMFNESNLIGIIAAQEISKALL
jgi:hypothetical protein